MLLSDKNLKKARDWKSEHGTMMFVFFLLLASVILLSLWYGFNPA
jgi:hypothetical protein